MHLLARARQMESIFFRRHPRGSAGPGAQILRWSLLDAGFREHDERCRLPGRKCGPLAGAVHQLWSIGVVLLAAMLAGCAAESAQQLAEKQRLLASYPPPGQARIWMFRTFQPEITQEQPYVRINGQIVGTALLGRAFYRDVPPGNYEVSVDSRGVAPNQFAHFGLAPGQTAYVAIDANGWWAGLCWRCQIPTFYTLVLAPQLARAELATLPLAGGG